MPGACETSKSLVVISANFPCVTQSCKLTAIQHKVMIEACTMITSALKTVTVKLP